MGQLVSARNPGVDLAPGMVRITTVVHPAHHYDQTLEVFGEPLHVSLELHRCHECRALLLDSDVESHADWHAGPAGRR